MAFIQLWGECPNGILVSELVNSFNRVEGSSESQSKGRGVKDPSTTRWRRGPVRHTAKFVKVFVMSRLDFGQGVWKGDSYRQTALIPTCGAPDSIVHLSCTQMCTIKIRDSREDITTQ